MDWLTIKLQNIVILFAISGAGIIGAWFWLKDKIKNYKHSRELKDARKDADIANEPNLDRDGVIKWLREFSKRS